MQVRKDVFMIIQKIFAAFLALVLSVSAGGLIVWCLIIITNTICGDIIARRITINKSRAKWEKEKIKKPD
jgi:hypothetical protein